MQRIQNEGNHEYLVSPSEYDDTSDRLSSTYDQFIQLRDTLIYSGKKYKGKGLLRLCVGEKEETIEVVERNIFRQQIEPDWATNPIAPGILGTYLTQVPADIIAQYPTFGTLCCMVNKSGRYRIVHKEEVLPQAGKNKVYCYVDVYRKNDQSVYEIAYKGGIAVFDWQGNFEKTFTGTTSGTDPNGSCSVKVSFVLGDIIQKMTAFGYMERDLLKDDILVLRMKDAETDPVTGENPGTDLTLQQWSNFWSIEYLDLPYNI